MISDRALTRSDITSGTISDPTGNVITLVPAGGASFIKSHKYNHRDCIRPKTAQKKSHDVISFDRFLTSYFSLKINHQDCRLVSETRKLPKPVQLGRFIKDDEDESVFKVDEKISVVHQTLCDMGCEGSTVVFAL